MNVLSIVIYGGGITAGIAQLITNTHSNTYSLHVLNKFDFNTR